MFCNSRHCYDVIEYKQLTPVNVLKTSMSHVLEQKKLKIVTCKRRVQHSSPAVGRP